MDELQMEHRVTAVEKLAGSNRHRLEDIEKRQDNLDELVKSVALFAQEQEYIKEDVKEIRADVKALTDKPTYDPETQYITDYWVQDGQYAVQHWTVHDIPVEDTMEVI